MTFQTGELLKHKNISSHIETYMIKNPTWRALNIHRWRLYNYVISACMYRKYSYFSIKKKLISYIHDASSASVHVPFSSFWPRTANVSLLRERVCSFSKSGRNPCSLGVLTRRPYKNIFKSNTEKSLPLWDTMFTALSLLPLRMYFYSIMISWFLKDKVYSQSM